MARKSTIPPPVAYWANAYQIGLVIAEAQAVVAMRMMGMAGVWSVTPAEDARMMSEKVQALTRAASDSTVWPWPADHSTRSQPPPSNPFARKPVQTPAVWASAA